MKTIIIKTISDVASVALNVGYDVLPPKNFDRDDVNPEKFEQIIDVHLMYGENQTTVRDVLTFTRKSKSSFIMSSKRLNKQDRSKIIKLNENHKGAWIGKMIEHILGNRNEIRFNFYEEVESYDWSQPDFMLLGILCVFYGGWKNVLDKKFLEHSTNASWFMGVYGYWNFDEIGYEKIFFPPHFVIEEAEKLIPR